MLFQDDQGDTHQWECTFSDPEIINQHGGYESKLVVVTGLDIHVNHFLEINGADSGKSVLVMKKATIGMNEVVVKVQHVIGVEAYKPDNTGPPGGFRGQIKPPKTSRRLADMTGTLNALVVRVNALDNSPVGSVQEISSDVFGDENNFKTQFAACSYNQLQIQEYIPGTVSDVPTQAPGVIDLSINVNATGNTRGEIQAQANIALETLLGAPPGSVFDIVMFCMPPGMQTNWLAYAYIGRHDSYYNNDWCQMMSSQLHEVGHTIGLHHSGEYEGSDSVQEYGDQTDLMGYSYKSDDTPRMCFNPAKNWQLGWYSSKQIEVDPNSLSTEPTSFLLNGITDYGDASSGAYVVIKVGDFYIGYNKKASFNDQVIEGANQLLVVEKLGGPTTSTKSKLAAKLNVGNEYNIVLTGLLSVRVKFAAFANNKDATIELTILGELPECQGEYDAEIVVDLTTDNYPQETSWGIADASGQMLFTSAEYDTAGTYSQTVGGLCRGLEYYFVIEDTYGDGICCNWGIGSFIGKFGELTLFDGAEFQSLLQLPFTIPLDNTPAPVTDPPTDAPTNPPTDPPTNPPTDAPTNPPTDPPTNPPTDPPTNPPTNPPTDASTDPPTDAPTNPPTDPPTDAPTNPPTDASTDPPTDAPTNPPTDPPTDAPTNPPTDASTSPPTDAPINPPTDPPTEPVGGCVDDPNYIYRDRAGDTCSNFVQQNTVSKTRKVCQRRANVDNSDRRKVYEYCKATCDAAGISAACA